jgi:DNA-binding NarL/FixJ family response regulator
MIEVLLIEEHPVVREGFRRFIETDSDFSLSAEADTGMSGYMAYRREKPDVVVMELALPDLDGFEVARRILKLDPDAKVLAFNKLDNELLVQRSMDLGMKGFITKLCDCKRVLQALRTVSSGGSHFPRCTADSATSLRGWGLERLTPREFDVFRHLAEGHSVATIAELLESCPKTVGVHQTRIMKKLGLRNGAQLAHLALGSGVINLTPVGSVRSN